jgi:hypothetical protein|nr:MAG TPA: hypothetical protein [Caudoviricetes sp.]
MTEYQKPSDNRLQELDQIVEDQLLPIVRKALQNVNDSDIIDGLVRDALSKENTIDLEYRIYINDHIGGYTLSVYFPQESVVITKYIDMVS